MSRKPPPAPSKPVTRPIRAKQNHFTQGQLTTIKHKDKLLRSFELILKDADKRNGQERAAELSKMKRELEVYQKRMTNARLLMLDGDLDAEDYRSAKSLLEPEIERLQRQITN